jgi:hypothetical protein
MGHMGFGEEYIVFNFDVFGNFQYLLLINQNSLQRLGVVFFSLFRAFLHHPIKFEETPINYNHFQNGWWGYLRNQHAKQHSC